MITHSLIRCAAMVLLSVALPVIGYAQVAVEWVQHHGSYTTDRANAVCVTPDRRVAVGGIFTDTLSLEGQLVVGKGFLDAYVAMFDSSGALIWLQPVQGPKNDQATHIAALPNGDVVAAGSFADSVTAGTHTVYALGNDDAWLARLSGADGSVQWLKAVGSQYAFEHAGGLAANDNFIFWAVNFGAMFIAGNDTAVAQGFNDAAVMTLSINGVLQNTRVISGSGNDQVTSIAIDAQGDVYVTGRFNGLFYDYQAAGGFDMFCGRLANGNGFDWLNAYGGAGSEAGTSLTVSDDVLFVSAWSNDTLVVGDSTVACDPGGEMLVIGHQLDGTRQWLFHGFPGTGNDYITASTKACNGDLLFTGYTTFFADQVPEIVPLAWQANSRSAAARCAFGDTYIARMNTSGDLLWIKSTLGTNLNSGLGIAADSAGRVYVCGYFTDSLYLKNTAIKGNGGNDAFVFRYNDDQHCMESDDTLSVSNGLVAPTNRFILSPNPSSDQAFLLLSGETTGAIEITLSDVTGRRLGSAVVASPGSRVVLHEVFDSVKSGIYLLKIRSGSGTWTLKWVKE